MCVVRPALACDPDSQLTQTSLFSLRCSANCQLVIMAIVGLHSRTAVPACRLTSQPSCPAVLRTSRQHSHRQASSSTARQPFVVRAEAEAAPAADLPLERSGNSFTALKDIEAIKKVLPHRWGMFIDCEYIRSTAPQSVPQITQITMLAGAILGCADASNGRQTT